MSSEDKIREDGLEEDALCESHESLRYRWQWSGVRHLAPDTDTSQVSFANAYDWTLEAIHWTSEYEARIRYNGEQITSKKGIGTRLHAQIIAEGLIVTFLREESLKFMRKGIPEQIEAGQGVNKNRVVDSLNALDSEFCQTFDALLALYKRIMIRAYTIKEEREKLVGEEKKAVGEILKEDGGS